MATPEEMRTFVQSIADMTKDGEMRDLDDGDPPAEYDMTIDDAFETVSGIIDEARMLLAEEDD